MRGQHSTPVNSRGSNGGLCLRRLGLELAAGGVKRPFACCSARGFDADRHRNLLSKRDSGGSKVDA